MRKVALWAIALLMMVCGTAFAESYEVLWKRYDVAIAKDLPRTGIDVLNQIAAQAKADRRYGTLLKTYICKASLMENIVSDSIVGEVQRLEKEEQALRNTQPVAAAVYQAALALMYQSNYSLGSTRGEKANEYFKMSLQNPEMLAKAQAKDFEPILIPGVDSRFFNNDLLHVLAIYAGEYRMMYDFYAKKGNRRAACIVAAMMFDKGLGNSFLDENEVKAKENKKLFYKSRIVHKLDSFMNVYSDLPEVAELAVVRYDYMNRADDVTVEQQIEYINYALGKWGSWQNMNSLRNAYKELTNPTFSAQSARMILPNQSRMVHFTDVRNIASITMKVWRLNVKGDFEEDVEEERVYKKLKRTMKAVPTATRMCKFVGKPNYVFSADSVQLEGLPVGMYLLELAADNKNVPARRMLMRVTNLVPIVQAMPNGRLRFAVLNATTGHPVPNAKIRITLSNYRTDKTWTEVLTCGDDGEVIYTETRNVNLESFCAYTKDDVYYQEARNRSWYGFSERETNFTSNYLYTDRSIYRPGQTVNVAGILMRASEDVTRKPVEGEKLKLTLYDANRKEVETKDVVTDAFGKYAAQFSLPNDGLTGRYSVQVTDAWRSTVSFNVEEYKRPTFEVSFPKVNEKYAPGDTVVVVGHAKSFAGVPVQGAQVSYEVKRTPAFWWWYDRDGNSSGNYIHRGTAVTDAQGGFSVSIPMMLPKDNKRSGFYNIQVTATVVDQGGETREASMALPLGAKATALDCNLPEKSEKDSLKSISFSFRNASGVEIPGNVRYYIDNESNMQTAMANTEIVFNAKAFKSGKHRLVAICENDTINQEFVLFSLTDSRPVTETPLWAYQTSTQFNSDNRPVYVQVGTSLKDTYVLYAIYSGNKVLEKGTTVLSDSLMTIPYTYKPEYGDGITISYVWVRGYNCYRKEFSIKRAAPDKRLVAEWKTFRNKLTPGQKEEWTLNLKYPNGKPANAQLIASLYDKSLEQIKKHQWSFDPSIYFRVPSVNWYWPWNLNYDDLSASYSFVPLHEKDFSFYHFDNSCFYYDRYSSMYELRDKGAGVTAKGNAHLRKEGGTRALMVRGSKAYSGEAKVSGYAVAEMMKDTADDRVEEDSKRGATNENPSVRTNLNETAFFYPALTSDANGDVAIKFTLPESITTWRFMGLATDKDMNNVLVENEAVASKKMMVQPNMPRFMRLGDKGWITARVINTTETALKGTALIEIVDPETEKVFYSETKNCTVDAGQTGNVSFLLNLQEGTKFYAAGVKVWVCRISVTGKGFSDGEQHYLPLLSDSELVTNSRTFTQHRAGTLNIDLRKLFAVQRPDNRLVIEYTNNPAWMMVQALPYMSDVNVDDAISLATSYYVNSLGNYLLNQAPVIKTTIEQWKQEKGTNSSMVSELQKNEDVKQLVLKDTPWVQAADNETAQRRELTRFFDENGIKYRLNEATNKLRALQKSNGSWAWYPKMMGNKYVTLSVLEMLTRLQTLTGVRTDMDRNLVKAFAYMGNEVALEVARMKKREKEGESNLRPSEWAVNYLYVCSLVDKSYYEDYKAEHAYLVDHLAKQPLALTIYGKAITAAILATNGYEQMAKEYLQSIREYSVFTEEMGRYYDTRKAYYSWSDYKIPTQVAAIEALQNLEPSDSTTIDQMKRWLLQQKRTQIWDTPINSVNAVYAFLKGNTQVLQAAADSPAKLSVDGKRIETTNASCGLGYVKTTMTGANLNTFTVNKTAPGTSWGAVYAQFTQRTTDITDASMGLSVKRELIYDGELKVGSKVKVRITITADRDYDFVQVVDKRAACMEPIDQISGYMRGYYYSPRDNATYYYTDMMRKGTHVIEATYYIDRPGTFTTGTCTVQCAYSPAYMARAKSQTLMIK